MPNDKKSEIETNIVNRFSHIKNLAESAITLFDKSKQVQSDEDITYDFSSTMEMTEQIQIEIEEIRELLCDLEAC